jgi:hypothetical protein
MKMKIVLIAIGVLILAGCAVGLVLTYQALGNTESELDAAQADVANLRQELLDTVKDLAETRDELQETADNLANTQSELEEQINDTVQYIDMYESSQEELEDVEKELNTTTGLLSSTQRENEDLQEAIDEIQEKLDLYEDTLGTQVFSGVNPPYRSGDALELVLNNNRNAKDPTWLELRAFLLEDKTDKHLYIPGEYECGNFAEELHNNAEAAGIRSAFVGIHFYDEIPHAINAFKTTDLGLVYVDDTGYTTSITLANLDKKATLAKNEAYVVTLIFPEGGWYLTQGNSKVQSIEIYW